MFEPRSEAPEKITVKETSLGRLTWRRYPSVRTFHCDHCGKDKTSRTEIAWQRPGAASTDTVCNGCYGELLAKAKDGSSGA